MEEQDKKKLEDIALDEGLASSAQLDRESGDTRYRAELARKDFLAASHKKELKKKFLYGVFTGAFGLAMTLGGYFGIFKPAIEKLSSEKSRAEERVVGLQSSNIGLSNKLSAVRANVESSLDELLPKAVSYDLRFNESRITNNDQTVETGSKNNEISLRFSLPSKYLNFDGSKRAPYLVLRGGNQVDQIIAEKFAPYTLEGGMFTLSINEKLQLLNGKHPLDVGVYFVKSEKNGKEISRKGVASIKRRFFANVDTYPCIYKTMDEWKANRDNCPYPLLGVSKIEDLEENSGKKYVLGKLLLNKDELIKFKKRLTWDGIERLEGVLEKALMDPCIYGGDQILIDEILPDLNHSAQRRNVKPSSKGIDPHETYTNKYNCVNPASVSRAEGEGDLNYLLFEYRENRPEKLIQGEDRRCEYDGHKEWKNNEKKCRYPRIMIRADNAKDQNGKFR